MAYPAADKSSIDVMLCIGLWAIPACVSSIMSSPVPPDWNPLGCKREPIVNYKTGGKISSTDMATNLRRHAAKRNAQATS